MHGCNEPRQHMSNLIYIQWKVSWWWRGRHSTNYVIIIKYIYLKIGMPHAKNPLPKTYMIGNGKLECEYKKWREMGDMSIHACGVYT